MEERKKQRHIKTKKTGFHLSSVAHVAVQFVDIMRTLKERIDFFFIVIFF